MKTLYNKALLLLAVTGAMAVFALLACISQKNGTGENIVYYEGSAPAYRGIIRVRVGVAQGAITEITVLESREDKAVGAAAIEELTDLVLLYNTTELDAVSGATETSKAFLAAIENAMLYYSHE